MNQSSLADTSEVMHTIIASCKSSEVFPSCSSALSAAQQLIKQREQTPGLLAVLLPLPSKVLVQSLLLIGNPGYLHACIAVQSHQLHFAMLRVPAWACAAESCAAARLQHKTEIEVWMVMPCALHGAADHHCHAAAVRLQHGCISGGCGLRTMRRVMGSAYARNHSSPGGRSPINPKRPKKLRIAPV